MTLYIFTGEFPAHVGGLSYGVNAIVHPGHPDSPNVDPVEGSAVILYPFDALETDAFDAPELGEPIDATPVEDDETGEEGAVEVDGVVHEGVLPATELPEAPVLPAFLVPLDEFDSLADDDRPAHLRGLTFDPEAREKNPGEEKPKRARAPRKSKAEKDAEAQNPQGGAEGSQDAAGETAAASTDTVGIPTPENGAQGAPDPTDSATPAVDEAPAAGGTGTDPQEV